MTTENQATVVLRRGADARVSAGHLWIFSNELEDGFQSLTPGDIVEVRDNRRNLIGVGTVNPHSLITVRLLARERLTVDFAFLRSRLSAAASLRARFLGRDETACRIVFGESDGLPGLIVDRFDDLFVVQTSTAGMDRLLPTVADVLTEMFSPVAIVEANDAHVRELEGLELRRGLLRGHFEGLKSFVQDEIHLLADPLNGQKTGYFFDQRLNRRMLGSFVKEGDSVLDLFCYTGGFGLYALQAGAGRTTFIDASDAALDITREAVSRNRWSDRADFTKADIFPFLKDHTEMYDAVVLDPPALAKSRSKVAAALRAYRDLNARAMERVKPGGILATASCSGLVQPSAWREALREAAAKSGRRLRIVAQGCQAPDHPVLAAMPETEYLKFVVAVVD
jgi:23S rRNA (cytosine1962-C5)-methyltransferase